MDSTVIVAASGVAGTLVASVTSPLTQGKILQRQEQDELLHDRQAHACQEAMQHA